ncbi:hypothetical protein CAPTEDRAFT_73088, partial [Capitella teleta]
DSNPCMNGGVCRESGDSFVCDCPQLWTGDNCETYDVTDGICNSEPCMNGGTCVLVDSANFYCNCWAAYSGELCEHWVDLCQGQDCWGEGYCEARDDGFDCVCPDDFAGTTCNLASVCDSNPCMNGGVCRESGDSFVCDCPQLWTGDNCETYDVTDGICNSEPCMNGGTCVLVDSANFYCNCWAAYSGELCEHWVDLCQGQDCWGEGYCEARDDGFDCVCPDDFAGTTCNLGWLLICFDNVLFNGLTCRQDL